MAERVGFEPTEDLHPRWFSRPEPSTTRPPLRYHIYILAEGLGLEPRLAESKSAVLPLDDPSTVSQYYTLDIG